MQTPFGPVPMKVSAVIPTFNRRRYIRRAIDSILGQTLPVDEILVIDDGSTDGTAEALDEWYGASIRVLRQERKGVSEARRCGVREAAGDWIAFLDSDDEWTPGRNARFYDAAGRVPPDVAWIFGDLRVVTDQGCGSTLFQEHGLALSDELTIFSDSLSTQHPFQFGMLQGSLIRRKVLSGLNCFSEGLQHSEDVLAGLQVACRYRFAAIPDEVGLYYRTSDLDTSSAVVNLGEKPDRYYARMLGYALIIESGRRRQWNRRYAEQARSLCRALARQGTPHRALAFHQFRYGSISLKGLAFCAAALFGTTGIAAWDALAALAARRGARDSGFSVPSVSSRVPLEQRAGDRSDTHILDRQ